MSMSILFGCLLYFFSRWFRLWSVSHMSVVRLREVRFRQWTIASWYGAVCKHVALPWIWMMKFLLWSCLSCTSHSLVKSRFGVTMFDGGIHGRLSLSLLPIRNWAVLYPHWRGVFRMISNLYVMSCLFSTCFLIMALVILTAALANQFDCGYRGLEVMWWIPHAVMNFRKRWDLYWVPLSDTSSSDIPCRLKMSFMTVITSVDIIRWSW